MGGPSTAIGVEELCQTGVTTFIRVGTCGGMQLDVVGGDLVVANRRGAHGGHLREYTPIEYPAVADLAVTNALGQAARALGHNLSHGRCTLQDSFYGQHAPERMPVGEELRYKWQAWIKAGCPGLGNGKRGLFIVAQALRVPLAPCLPRCGTRSAARAGLSQPRDARQFRRHPHGHRSHPHPDPRRILSAPFPRKRSHTANFPSSRIAPCRHAGVFIAGNGRRPYAGRRRPPHTTAGRPRGHGAVHPVTATATSSRAALFPRCASGGDGARCTGDRWGILDVAGSLVVE